MLVKWTSYQVCACQLCQHDNCIVPRRYLHFLLHTFTDCYAPMFPGHYTATVRRVGAGGVVRWFRCNDDKDILIVQEDKVVTTQ